MVQDVVLNCRKEFRKVVLRLGGFHEACTDIARIRKIWADAGLTEMLTDSGVYALGTARSMLEGKMFH